jgi:hypothetical protein
MENTEHEALPIDCGKDDVEIWIEKRGMVASVFRSIVYAVRDIWSRMNRGWGLYAAEDGMITLIKGMGEAAAYSFGQTFPAALALVNSLCRPDPLSREFGDLVCLARRYRMRRFVLISGNLYADKDWDRLTRDVSIIAVGIIEPDDLLEADARPTPISVSAMKKLYWRGWSADQIAVMYGVGPEAVN